MSQVGPETRWTRWRPSAKKAAADRPRGDRRLEDFVDHDERRLRWWQTARWLSLATIALAAVASPLASLLGGWWLDGLIVLLIGVGAATVLCATYAGHTLSALFGVATILLGPTLLVVSVLLGPLEARVAVPAVLMIAAVASVPVVRLIWAYQPPRQNPYACPQCGYLMINATSHRCPECDTHYGTPVLESGDGETAKK